MGTTTPAYQLDYPISADQAAAFQRDGHLLLRGVLPPADVPDARSAIVAAADRYCPEMKPLEERDTYGKAFLQIMNLWTQDEAVRAFVMARRFGRIAAELMGVDGVRIYHDQALFKEAGGGPTPWHQDEYYWPLDTDNTITMWMPLVDVGPDMGTMRFASGSHRLGYLGAIPISDESEARFDQFVKDRGFTIGQTGAMAAGDATFHTGWTLHGAPGNASDRTRQVMTIIYFADGTRASTPDNKNRIDDLENWLPGIRPGALAASRLNPVVYRRGRSDGSPGR